MFVACGLFFCVGAPDIAAAQRILNGTEFNLQTLRGRQRLYHHSRNSFEKGTAKAR
jgi:hypothetical protein